MKFNKPTITPSQLNIFTEPVTDIYQALEEQVFEMIAKRLKTNKDLSKDHVFAWQVEKMQQLRMLNQETIATLSKVTGIATKEIQKSIENTGIATIKSVDNEVKNIYKPLPMPTHIDRILETFVGQAFKDYNNYINESLITTHFGQGTVTDMYRKIIEQTTSKVLAGTTTINQAVTETIIEWGNRGLNTGFVDRGGNIWTLERYANSVIRTTTNNVYNQLRVDRMQDYNLNLVVVSSLPDPREACSHIQGKVASLEPIEKNKSKYPSVYEFGFGEPWGLRGINCRHMFFPFIEGVNENNQKQFTEEEMTRNREVRQKQRYYERQIRQAKRSLNIAKTTNDTKSIEKQNRLLRNRQARIREFVKENELARFYENEKVYI